MASLHWSGNSKGRVDFHSTGICSSRVWVRNDSRLMTTWRPLQFSFPKKIMEKYERYIQSKLGCAEHKEQSSFRILKRTVLKSSLGLSLSFTPIQLDFLFNSFKWVIFLILDLVSSGYHSYVWVISNLSGVHATGAIRWPQVIRQRHAYVLLRPQSFVFSVIWSLWLCPFQSTYPSFQEAAARGHTSSRRLRKKYKIGFFFVLSSPNARCLAINWFSHFRWANWERY
jgi:hypothetical protein